MGRATEDLMDKLHGLVAQDLIDKIQSGEASAQELNAAIKFLKDNGIESVPGLNENVNKLAASLPEFDDEDDTVVPIRGA